jgi:hypothetical protein
MDMYCCFQNEYFEYGDSAQEPEFDHDILYRAGVNQRVINEERI